VLLEVRQGEELTGTLLYTTTLPELAPAATAVVTVTPGLGLGEHTLLVLADPQDAILELDETNNLAIGEVRIVLPGPYRYYLPVVGREAAAGVSRKRVRAITPTPTPYRRYLPMLEKWRIVRKSVPAATPTPTATPTMTPTPTPTATPTMTPIATPMVMPAGTLTPTPTVRWRRYLPVVLR